MKAGKRIRTARNALGWSLETLAGKVQTLSASRIGNYEQGTRELGIAEAELLAGPLKRPAAWLMGLVDDGDMTLLMLPKQARNGLLVALGTVTRVEEQEKSGDRPTESEETLPAQLQRIRGA